MCDGVGTAAKRLARRASIQQTKSNHIPNLCDVPERCNKYSVIYLIRVMLLLVECSACCTV